MSDRFQGPFCNLSWLLPRSTPLLTLLVASGLSINATSSAQASPAPEVALSFDLAPVASSNLRAQETPSNPTHSPEDGRLPIPAIAATIPLGQGHPTTEPALAELPPAPKVAIAPFLSPTPQTSIPPRSSQPYQPRPVQGLTQFRTPEDLAALFVGGEMSWVAIAVGSAEGTRTPNGQKNPAYWGHTDPGNGVWNLGSFSYQSAASTPEDADRRQLARLWQQAIALQQQAIAQNLTLSLQETLNGIDLANQSPQAALSTGGYIDRLVEARAMGLQDAEAIHWARVRAFLDPDTRQWNAPGLGNQVSSISADQERRMEQITQVVEGAIASSGQL